MMHEGAIFFAVLGRILMGLVFIASVWCDFQSRDAIKGMLLNKKMPMPEILFYAGAALKVVCGFGLVFGLYAALAAFVLGLFTMGANFIFHDFWRQPVEARQTEMGLFLVHLGLAAGCFGLIAI